jgi:hypothetical protein
LIEAKTDAPCPCKGLFAIDQAINESYCPTENPRVSD